MGINQELWINTDCIVFNKFNPNKISPEKRAALMESILRDGVQQPVIVRKGLSPGTYEMIDGENRAEIAKVLQIPRLKAILKDVNNLEAMRLCYKLNAERGTIDCFKEAVFFDLLAQTGLLTRAEAAGEYGVSEQYIKDRKKLLSINVEEKELLLKKAPRELELTGVHWLAYAKASPEARIELCKTIGRQGNMSVRDFETEVKNAEYAVKRQKEFEEAVEKTEFKTCPTCKGKPIKLDWQKRLECAQYHDWDPKTGKTGQQIMGGTYNKTEKAKKPKFRRSLDIEIDWPRAYKDAQEFVLKNLGEINSVSFMDKKKKEWHLGISRHKDFGHITIKQGYETEVQLVRNYRGKTGSSVCGPAAGEITKKDYESMLALVKQFKAKVTDKRIAEKKKKAVKKKCNKK